MIFVFCILLGFLKPFKKKVNCQICDLFFQQSSMSPLVSLMNTTTRRMMWNVENENVAQDIHGV